MFKENNRTLLIYLLKFLGAFCLLFYGTEAIIGLSAPGGAYSPFVAAHLNFIQPLREGLLLASKAALSLVGYQTYLQDTYTLKMPSGHGVRMVYSCIGYGVISFWLAFVFANRGSVKKKAAWMIGGVLALCGINILRVALLIVATFRGWPIPLGWDHHTWFNLVAYALIFTMIWLYDRSGKKPGGRMEPGRREGLKERRVETQKHEGKAVSGEW